MKHYFIQQNYLPRLTLFFAGWGMDECPFMDYCSGNSDLLVCYDYRSLDFDFTLLQGYQEIRLIAGLWEYGPRLWYCRIWTCPFVRVLL